MLDRPGRRSSTSRLSPAAVSQPATDITPAVTVPVLSSRTVSRLGRPRAPGTCDEDAQLRTPAAGHHQRRGCGEAQRAGHAMISTASAALNAGPAALPASSQPARVRAEAARTAGTKTPQIRSASRCTADFATGPARPARPGARAACPGPRAARTTIRPPRRRCPQHGGAPATSAGTDSPVIMLASTADSPNSTTPSAAMTSPGPDDDPVSRSQPQDRHAPLGAVTGQDAGLRAAAATRGRASHRRRCAGRAPHTSGPASRKVVTDAATSR